MLVDLFCILFTPVYFPSSSTQYVESQGNPYTFSKVVCESVLDMYRRLYSLDFVLMFYYNVYGPGEADYGEAKEGPY